MAYGFNDDKSKLDITSIQEDVSELKHLLGLKTNAGTFPLFGHPVKATGYAVATTSESNLTDLTSCTIPEGIAVVAIGYVFFPNIGENGSIQVGIKEGKIIHAMASSKTINKTTSTMQTICIFDAESSERTITLVASDNRSNSTNQQTYGILNIFYV